MSRASILSDMASQGVTAAEFDVLDGGITTLGTVTAGNISHADIVYPAGHILQVISSVKSDTDTKTASGFSTIAGTDQDGSGSVWCAKLTPAATSNKVLIMVTVAAGCIADSYPAFILYRNAVPLGKGATHAQGEEVTFGGAIHHGTTNTSNVLLHWNYTYLDSPSLDNEITYQLEYSSMRTTTREIHINRSVSVGDTNQVVSSSTLTLMEVAG